MTVIRVFDVLRMRALVTRESAHAIRQAMTSAAGNQSDELALDFAGVDAVTPSFVDELLAIADDVVRQSQGGPLKMLFLNAPTTLSNKFTAIGRLRGIRITETQPGAWVLTGEASAA